MNFSFRILCERHDCLENQEEDDYDLDDVLKIFGVEKDDEGDEGNNAIPKGPNGVKTSFSGMFLYKSYGIRNYGLPAPEIPCEPQREPIIQPTITHEKKALIEKQVPFFCFSDS